MNNLKDILNPDTPGTNCNNIPTYSNFEPELLKLSTYADLPELIDSIKKNDNQLNVLSLNIQSLHAKFTELQLLVDSINSQNLCLHIIGLQETWLKDSDDCCLLQLNGYDLIHKPSHRKHANGGLAFYIHNSLKFKLLDSLESDICEDLAIEIAPKTTIQTPRKIIFHNIYRPPSIYSMTHSCAIQTFVEQFSSLCSKLSHQNYVACCVLGDFNLDCLKVNENLDIASFIDSAMSQGFIPQITLPSRFSVQYGSSSLIDNIFLKTSEQTIDCHPHILTRKISDHFGCFLGLNINLGINKKGSKKIKVTSNSDEDLLKFKSILSEMNILDKLDKSFESDPSENYKFLSECLNNARSQAFKTRMVKFDKYKHKRNPWVTKGIMKSIHFKDELNKTLSGLRFHSLEWFICKYKLSVYKNILNKSIRIAKKIYYEDLFEHSKSNIKKTWQNINFILNRRKIDSNLPDCFEIDGTLISDPKQIADAFNNFFINIGPKLAAELHSPEGVSFTDFLTDKQNCTFTFTNVDESNVGEVLDSLKPKTSFGHDCISNKLLKSIKNEIISPLTLIINQSFNTGIFPKELKLAKVIPVFKKGESSKLNNYRPISLLPSMSKVFERIMHSQLTKYLTDNNLLFAQQYGFRPKHSTELAIVDIVDRLLKSMDSDLIPFSVYIDLSKAFDTLVHSILLNKLAYYGIHNNALALLSDYLNDRQQYVDINGISSSLGNISTGVPQGSILGPLLFLIYINDLSKSSEFFQFLSYADDTTLLCNLDSKCNNLTVTDKINTELSRVYVWLTVNKLSLNIDKTKYMLFYKPNRKNIPKVEPSIANKNLDQVSCFNFLGVNIDSALSWKSHINKISSKIAKSCGIISKLKHFLPKQILMNIYNALLLPHLNYAILVWGFASTKRLLLLQNKAVRSISKSHFFAHAPPIFKQLKILTIDEILLSSLLKFYFRLKNSLLPRYFSNFTLEPAQHKKATRFSSLISRPDLNKDYTRNCLRYALVEILNYCNKPKSSVDKKIYETDTKLNKLFIKPPELIQAIIDKTFTHSIDGFAKYIKIRFLDPN